ncbi:MAG: DUF6036 family nucleotidyltransferase [Endomicrobiales bacterium]
MKLSESIGVPMAEEKHVENDYRDFIDLLNKNKVDYIIIGAYSTIFHTKIARETQDIDFWIRKTESNAERCVAAIKDFCGLDIDKNELMGDKEIFFIGQAPNRIDIFNMQGKMSFEEAFSRKNIGTFKGTQAYFIAKDDLIKLKEYFGRDQDTKDLIRLKKLSKRD